MSNHLYKPEKQSDYSIPDYLIEVLQQKEVRQHLADNSLSSLYSLIKGWSDNSLCSDMTNFFTAGLGIDPLKQVSIIWPGMFMAWVCDFDLTDYTNLHIVDNNAFLGSECEFIYLPDSIQFINDYAFDGCDCLRQVKITGNGISSLGDGAFTNCSKLEKVWLPHSLNQHALGNDWRGPFVETNIKHWLVLVYDGTKEEFMNGEPEIGFVHDCKIVVQCNNGVINIT